MFVNDSVHHSGKAHKRVNFTKEEDEKLKQLVARFGENNKWKQISDRFPNRNIRQLKDRWTNYLSPNVVNRAWTQQEDFLLLQSIQRFGRKWKSITQFFPGRTDIQIKSRFNVLQRKYKNEEKMRDNFIKQICEKAYSLSNKRKRNAAAKKSEMAAQNAASDASNQVQQMQQPPKNDFFGSVNDSSNSIFSSNDYKQKDDNNFPVFEMDYLNDVLFDTIDFLQDL